MRQPKPNERGSVYIMVLGVAMLVTIMGVGGMLAVQAQGREVQEARDTQQAQQCSRAAIELAQLALTNDPSWRTTYTSGTWTPAQVFGGGTLSWRFVDETDGNLANKDTDSVRLYGMGTAGTSVRVSSVVLSATIVPIGAMQTALHTEATISIPTATYNGSPVVMSVSGGPLSCKADLTNLGAITGDVEALAVTGTGTVSGTTATPAPTRTMPAASVFNDYLAAANPPRTIPWNNTNFPSGVANFNVLTPTLATPNAITYQSDGLYLIQVPAATILTIDKCRLNCTLLIDAGAGSTVKVGSQTLWTPARADYPLAIIRGATNVQLDARGVGGLSESALAKNFNPPGFPYNAVSNATNTDIYDAYLNGVVHVIGTACITRLFPQLSTNGCIICDGPVTYPGGGSAAPAAALKVDPLIVASPPKGYYAVTMTPVTSSWRRDAAP